MCYFQEAKIQSRKYHLDFWSLTENEIKFKDKAVLKEIASLRVKK
jgi:hypothetical protein